MRPGGQLKACFGLWPVGQSVPSPSGAISRVGERARLVCSYGRRARNIVGQISLTGFRRDAENGNRDGRAPHSKIVAADVNRLIILRAVFGWSGTHVRCYSEKQAERGRPRPQQGTDGDAPWMIR